MAQIFQPYADTAVCAALLALAASPAIIVGAGYAIPRSPYVAGQLARLHFWWPKVTGRLYPCPGPASRRT